MNKMVMIGCVGALIVLALVLGLFLVGQYNTLVTGNEQVSEAWSQVENVYQRRADLVPNLVATVKGYATHESTVFQKVTEARANAIAAGATGGPEQRAGRQPAAVSRFTAPSCRRARPRGRSTVLAGSNRSVSSAHLTSERTADTPRPTSHR